MQVISKIYTNKSKFDRAIVAMVWLMVFTLFSLLYYRIIDFTTTAASSGTHTLLKDNYVLGDHYCKSRQNDIKDSIQDGRNEVKHYVRSILKSKVNNYTILNTYECFFLYSSF